MERTKQKPGIGDEAVRAKTGRDWAEWLAVLDAAGAAKMTHKEISRISMTTTESSHGGRKW